MEQDNRLRAALVKLNLTVAATDKLDDAVELVEADQSAVLSDFNELKQEVMQMKADIEKFKDKIDKAQALQEKVQLIDEVLVSLGYLLG